MAQRQLRKLTSDFDEHSKGVEERLRQRRLERERRLKQQRAQMQQLDAKASAVLSSTSATTSRTATGTTPSTSYRSSYTSTTSLYSSPRATYSSSRTYTPASTRLGRPQPTGTSTPSSTSTTSSRRGYPGDDGIGTPPARLVGRTSASSSSSSLTSAPRAPVLAEVRPSSREASSSRRRKSSSSSSAEHTPHYLTPTQASLRRANRSPTASASSSTTSITVPASATTPVRASRTSSATNLRKPGSGSGSGSNRSSTRDSRSGSGTASGNNSGRTTPRATAAAATPPAGSNEHSRPSSSSSSVEGAEACCRRLASITADLERRHGMRTKQLGNILKDVFEETGVQSPRRATPGTRLHRSSNTAVSSPPPPPVFDEHVAADTDSDGAGSSANSSNRPSALSSRQGSLTDKQQKKVTFAERLVEENVFAIPSPNQSPNTSRVAPKPPKASDAEDLDALLAGENLTDAETSVLLAELDIEEEVISTSPRAKTGDDDDECKLTAADTNDVSASTSSSASAASRGVVSGVRTPAAEQRDLRNVLSSARKQQHQQQPERELDAREEGGDDWRAEVEQRARNKQQQQQQAQKELSTAVSHIEDRDERRRAKRNLRRQQQKQALDMQTAKAEQSRQRLRDNVDQPSSLAKPVSAATPAATKKPAAAAAAASRQPARAGPTKRSHNDDDDDDMWAEAQAELTADPDMDLSDILDHTSAAESAITTTTATRPSATSGGAKSPQISGYDDVCRDANMLDHSAQRARIELAQQRNVRSRSNTVGSPRTARQNAGHRHHHQHHQHEHRQQKTDVSARAGPGRHITVSGTDAKKEFAGHSLAYMMNQQAMHGRDELRTTGARLTPTGQPELNRTHFQRQPSLYRVCGRVRACMQRLPLHFSSLSQRECFVLDAVGTLYVWEGQTSKRVTRAFAHSIAIDISDEEYGTRASIHKVHGDSPADHHLQALQRVLEGDVEHIGTGTNTDTHTRTGTEAATTSSDADDGGDAAALAYMRGCQLYDVVGSPVMLSSGREMSRLQLVSAKAFAVVCPDEVYLWLGSRFDKSLHAPAQSMVDTLRGDRPVFVEREGLESIIFRHKFAHWADVHKEYFSADDDDDHTGAGISNNKPANASSNNTSNVPRFASVQMPLRDTGGRGHGDSHIGHFGEEAQHALESERTHSEAVLGGKHAPTSSSSSHRRHHDDDDDDDNNNNTLRDRHARSAVSASASAGTVSSNTRRASSTSSTPGRSFPSRAERTHFYTYDQLTAMQRLGRMPEDVDPTAPEQALTRRDFLECFGMTPEDFAYLPRWSRMQQSKRVFLQSDA
ncbi:hypothetical protein PTSG_03811 [Salpingoeca rosetta]|uniref:HP domain-containing protein n=1 Tax=Salpingoeca rosetta (strain ATCC 50818 / BSB-021) TaxID=946362 RepID=F2U5G4_SALR5|nr:uncharacterized protein PTSG_03811 [Salpingoeca rosetta]EGD83180.1 hypothetical protein PTSG_03811 [Salpingoeca rosetta]|eukprot:XP_004995544.1 hypothetical protein PTSG_03811 [Salpingoeca rosetta]